MSEWDLIRPQLYAFRAQLDALILLSEMHAGLTSQPLPVNPATTCPNCGSEGDSQIDRSTLDGTKRIHCSGCGQERILPRVA